MNAAIRPLTRRAIHEGFEVFGIERGLFRESLREKKNISFI